MACPIHELVLWPPPPPLHPLSKLLAIQDHAQNLEEQLWMGERREVSIISYRPVTSSDLKHEISFQHFCNWLSVPFLFYYQEMWCKSHYLFLNYKLLLQTKQKKWYKTTHWLCLYFDFNVGCWGLRSSFSFSLQLSRPTRAERHGRNQDVVSISQQRDGSVSLFRSLYRPNCWQIFMPFHKLQLVN